MSSRIVVTGASGFVGTCVVEALFLAGGYDIVPTARRSYAGGRVARYGCRLRAADLTNRSDVNGITAGAQAVIHCAFGADTNQEDATRNLLDSSADAGVPIFIHLSTTEVYATQTDEVTEDAPIRAEGDDYGAIKGRIDALVQSFANRFRSVAILRPAIIYGPLSDAWTITPVRRFSGGWQPETRSMQGTGNFVHVADLSRIIEYLASSPNTGLRIYNVTGSEPVSWENYFRGIAREMGIELIRGETSAAEKAQVSAVRAGLRWIPTGIRRSLVSQISSLDPAKRLIAHWRRLHTLEPGASEMALYSRNVRYSITRLVRDGLAPSIGLPEGIHHSISWARDVGLID